MKKGTFVFALIAALILTSCGGKPGGLRKTQDMVPEFTKRLNYACSQGIYDDLLRLFDRNAKIMIQTEFNPEIHQGLDKVKKYFSAIPIDTKFEIGAVESKELEARTRYSFLQPNGVNGTGTWKFRFNNMGKINELTVIPGVE